VITYFIDGLCITAADYIAESKSLVAQQGLSGFAFISVQYSTGKLVTNTLDCSIFQILIKLNQHKYD